MPHVAIIGAGPAGCTAAISLARANGWRVTLVEQHRFPRDKVCGECLGALGIDVLERLDLSRDTARQLNPVRFARTNLYAPGDARLSLPLPRPIWGVSRRSFDAFLLDKARRAGASVLQPARCERVNGTVTVRLLASNSIVTLDPDFVLVADGKAALLPVRPEPTGDFGIKAHFEHVDGPRDAIELFGTGGCYGGLAGVEDARWNMAFSVPQSRLHACAGDVDRLFARMLDANAALHSRLRNSNRVTDWLVAPLPRFDVTSNWGAKVIPIGNAAAALEPIGGEGMGLAMRSAELAAAELIRAHREGRAPAVNSLRTSYVRLWRTRRLACRAAALAISSTRAANLGLRVVPTTLARLTLRLTGKTR